MTYFCSQQTYFCSQQWDPITRQKRVTIGFTIRFPTEIAPSEPVCHDMLRGALAEFCRQERVIPLSEPVMVVSRAVIPDEGMYARLTVEVATRTGPYRLVAVPWMPGE